jgi:hypothetical protein
MPHYGPLILFGSGETARQGRQVQEEVLRELPVPARVAILETPAGFQPNAHVVAQKLQQFVEKSLQNYKPQVALIQACRKGGPGDPDDPAVYGPLKDATYVLAGPGSPTYAVRHLKGTRTWALVNERWAAGAGLALASAAAIALGAHVLPVYEIYKAGADLHWCPGLDLLRDFGLEGLAIVPHWDNREGGADLDTSRGFMGVERFARLLDLLPPDAVVLGLDEHTSCIVDVNAETVRVRGQGELTVIRDGAERRHAAGEELPLTALGPAPLLVHDA